MRLAKLGRGAFLGLLLALAAVSSASGFEFADGRLQVHGFVETQFRGIADSFHPERWYLSQWANIANVEIEADLFPSGIGPFELVQAYVRLEARYDCVFNQACGLGWSRPFKYFGDRAESLPPNLADGRSQGRSGVLATPNDASQRIHLLPDPFTDAPPNGPSELRSFLSIPPLDQIIGLSSNKDVFRETFAPVLDAEFGIKHIKGSANPEIFPLGPWHPRTDIHANGILGSVDSMTNSSAGLPDCPASPRCTPGGEGPNGDGSDVLPLRVDFPTLYIPSLRLEDHLDDLDSFDQNFRQRELQWNRGAAQQQTKELKEAYLDLELDEGRLFIRAGKQSIVWGKTELFRTTDQFNPQDLGLSSLPSLEESRIPLWSIRGIYSFYDVGPLEDVRLELAANLDHYEPNDFGRCGEPYTVFLICGKAAGLFFHGLIGLGLAGEERPPDWWESSRGLEFGGRVEFRWERFSFQISNFYGYDDLPVAETLNEYVRNVDPLTGRPRRAGMNGSCGAVADSNGDGFPDDPSCLVPGMAANENSGNRQFFEVFNRATGGLAADVIPNLDSSLLDLFNNREDPPPAPFNAGTFASLFSSVLAGGGFGESVISNIGGVSVNLVQLNADSGDPGLPADGACLGGIMGVGAATSCLTAFLTVEQQALLGCGPFYGTDCNGEAAFQGGLPGGFDFFNAEGSVLVQAFPQFEPGPDADPRCFFRGRRIVPCPFDEAPVASRITPQGLVTLPGARSIFDPQYDPAIDGCVGKAFRTIPIPAPDPNVSNAVGPTLTALAADGLARAAGVCDGSHLLATGGIDPSTIVIDPMTGFPDPDVLMFLPGSQLFVSELAALSYNFVTLIASFDPDVTDPASPCKAEFNPASGAGPFECGFVQSIFRLFGIRRPDLKAGGNGRFGRRDFLWHGSSELVLSYPKRNVFGFAMDFAEDRSKTNWGLEFTWFENQSFQNRDTFDGVSRRSVYNLTVSVDRPTFINFLNPNRTIIFNTQWFLRYIPHYERGGTFSTNGPFNALYTFNIFTGYFQDRLLVFATHVHDFQSASGGGIARVIYRFNERFSVSVGVAAFYGGPEKLKAALTPIIVGNDAGNHSDRSNYFNGLTAIAERDEISATIRYTF